MHRDKDCYQFHTTNNQHISMGSTVTHYNYGTYPHTRTHARTHTRTHTHTHTYTHTHTHRHTHTYVYTHAHMHTHTHCTDWQGTAFITETSGEDKVFPLQDVTACREEGWHIPHLPTAGPCRDECTSSLGPPAGQTNQKTRHQSWISHCWLQANG